MTRLGGARREVAVAKHQYNAKANSVSNLSSCGQQQARTYGTPKSAGKNPMVGDIALPFPFLLNSPNCNNHNPLEKRCHPRMHQIVRRVHCRGRSLSELLGIRTLPTRAVGDAAIRHLLLGSAASDSISTKVTGRVVSSISHRGSTASAPRAYTGMTFSSLMPALHTGHSEWFCIHCAQQLTHVSPTATTKE